MGVNELKLDDPCRFQLARNRDHMMLLFQYIVFYYLILRCPIFFDLLIKINKTEKVHCKPIPCNDYTDSPVY